MYLPFNLSGDVTAQISLQSALKFNGGGHINHSIFWTNLSPNGGGEPAGWCCGCGLSDDLQHRGGCGFFTLP